MKLIIDTSSFCTLAILADDNWQIKAFKIESAKDLDDGTMTSHNEALHTVVEQLLSIDSPKICEIVVGVGPGSFTGIRIGLSFAIGLALGNLISVRAVPSLQLFSRLLESEDNGTILHSDARRTEYYVFVCDSKGNLLVSEKIISQDELDKLKLEYPKFACIDTSSTSLWEGILSSSLSNKVSNPSNQVNLSTLGQLFTLQDLHQIEPLYLRQVAAKTIAERSASLGS